MKPPQVIGLVAIAVLITLAIEEYRISALRDGLPPVQVTEVATSSETVSQTSTGDPGSPLKTKSSPEARPVPPVIAPSAIMGESFSSNARKMWENPAGKSMMSQGAKVAVTMMYQDFIDGMKLTKEEGDYFKNLLGREVSDQQELGMKMLEASPEERTELAEELTKRGAQTQEEIKKFLNNEDDFKAYNNYKNRIPERQQLDGIRTAMSTKGVPLDAAVEGKLVDAMYRARAEAKSPDLSGPEAMKDLANGDLVGNFEKTWQAQQEFLAKETTGILNAEQTAAFQEYRSR